MITGIKYTETPSPLRTCYTFEGPTPRGERLYVEFWASDKSCGIHMNRQM